MAARRVVSVLLAAVLLLGLCAGVAALPSEDYTLTGDEAEDIVRIAAAQKGKLIDDFGWTVDWCAYFVCWAGAKAGADFPNVGTARAMALWFLNQKKGDFYCLRDENYESLVANGLQDLDAPVRTFHEAFAPKKGDLICFSWLNDGFDWSHIGIVAEDYDGSGYIQTVEGNTRLNGVYQVATMRRKYNETVVGFIRPHYRVKTPPVDNRPKITLSTEELTIGLGDEGGASLHATASGNLPAQVGYEVQLDRPELLELFTQQQGSELTISLVGKAEGSGTLAVRLLNAESGALLSERTARVTVVGGSYTVHYDANGGTGAPESQTQRRGQTLRLSTKEPVREGYTFAGWAESAEATVVRYRPGEQYTAGRDVTLYAVWERAKVNYTVRHYQMGLPGEAAYRLVEEERLSAYAGETVTPGVKSYAGFLPPEPQTLTVRADGSASVSYYYRRGQFALELTKEEGVAEVSGGGQYYYGEKLQLAANLRRGYRFAGWYAEDGALFRGELRPEGVLMPAEELRLTARAVRDTAAGGCPFPDSEEHWGREAICYVWERDLFRGVTDDSFAPEERMSRAMVVTVLHRAAGTPEASSAPVFADVPAEAWYAGAVAWATERGVVEGTGAGFDPNGAVTREQLAVILYRYAGATPEGLPLNFPDRAEVSYWAVEAVAWATGRGLLRGRTDGTLDPKGTASRAEVATILMRYLELTK